MRVNCETCARAWRFEWDDGFGEMDLHPINPASGDRVPTRDTWPPLCCVQSVQDRIDVGWLLNYLCGQVEPRGMVLYEVLYRNAGVALRWSDPHRCKTPKAKPIPQPPIDPEETREQTLRRGREAVRLLREAQMPRMVRLQESLYLERYYESLRAAVIGELARLAAAKPPRSCNVCAYTSDFEEDAAVTEPCPEDGCPGELAPREWELVEL